MLWEVGSVTSLQGVLQRADCGQGDSWARLRWHQMDGIFLFPQRYKKTMLKSIRSQFPCPDYLPISLWKLITVTFCSPNISKSASQSRDLQKRGRGLHQGYHLQARRHQNTRSAALHPNTGAQLNPICRVWKKNTEKIKQAEIDFSKVCKSISMHRRRFLVNSL